MPAQGLAALGATAHVVLRRWGVIPTLRLLAIGCGSGHGSRCRW